MNLGSDRGWTGIAQTATHICSKGNTVSSLCSSGRKSRIPPLFQEVVPLLEVGASLPTILPRPPGDLTLKFPEMPDLAADQAELKSPLLGTLASPPDC